jgi:hypothetical protein
MATFLFAQAPNRKGNQSKHTPKHSGGVTADTNPHGDVVYAKGHVGHEKPGREVTQGRHQKVQLHTPEAYVNRTKTPYMDGSDKAVKR